MWTYWLDHQYDWNEDIPFLMFTAHKSVQEFLRFNLFELIFGYSVCSPLKVLKEGWLWVDPTTENFMDYLSQFWTRLTETCELAYKNLWSVQCKIKVLILLPLLRHPLQSSITWSVWGGQKSQWSQLRCKNSWLKTVIADVSHQQAQALLWMRNDQPYRVYHWT